MDQHSIVPLLKRLVAIPSLTDSPAERPMAELLGQILLEMPYFQSHPQQCGLLPIANDYLGRQVAFGLVRGTGSRTVILMNHYDVVPVEEYGALQSIAFDVDALPAGLAKLDLDPETRADLESGEWLFGRGCGDMKGGTAVQLACLKAFSEEKERPGNLLFLSIPDEESYSAGMRGALPMLLQLKETYGLEYELLIDSEPVPQVERDGVRHQILSVGSVGKVLPVVLVQGEKAHISQCFNGLNPLGILTEIYRATDLSLDFCETCQGEVVVPPTWTFLRDRKESYDVSLPLRAAGYFNLLSFTSTPEELMERLSKICLQAFQTYVDRVDGSYRDFQKLSGKKVIHSGQWVPQVLTFQELCAELRQQYGAAFEQVMVELRREAGKRLHAKEWNYPQATLWLMEQILDRFDRHGPLVLLGFAPPYYPAYHSQHLPGKEAKARSYSAWIQDYSQRELELPMVEEQYCQGISDCSYCGLNTKFDTSCYAENAPLWSGELYSIDFDALEKLAVPAVLLGPWGKDPHRYTERVNVKALTETAPQLITALVHHVLTAE